MLDEYTALKMQLIQEVWLEAYKVEAKEVRISTEAVKTANYAASKYREFLERGHKDDDSSKNK